MIDDTEEDGRKTETRDQVKETIKTQKRQNYKKSKPYRAKKV